MIGRNDPRESCKAFRGFFTDENDAGCRFKDEELGREKHKRGKG
jgi:hypothetical protein